MGCSPSILTPANSARRAQFAHIIRREDMQLSALLLLISIRIGLWLFPFRWLQGLALRASNRAKRHNPIRPARVQTIPDLIQVIRKVARRVPAATCLTQALTAQILLARTGHPSTLRIGVLRAATGRINAHAWLEIEGKIVIGGDAPGMAEFKPLPLKSHAETRRRGG
jgi:hypothetical protein